MANDNNDLQADTQTAGEVDALNTEQNEDIIEEAEEKQVSNLEESEEAEQVEGQSDRAKSRQHELAQRLKQAEDRLREYELRGNSEHSASTNIVEELEWKLNKDATPEYTGDWESDLELVRSRAIEEAKAEVKRELQFERDIEQAENKYPELDHKSPEKNEDLIKLINETWQLAGGLKSGRRFGEFVDKFMRVQKQSKSLGAEESLAKLREQESQQAVTPSGTNSRKTTNFKDLSLKEMEQQLGFANYD